MIAITPKTSNGFSLRAMVKHMAGSLESRPVLILATLTALYALMLVPLASRPLWHDELYTLYIANAPSFQRFLEEVRTLDLNPPLIYLVTRIANRILGTTPLATRVPSFLAFYGFSLFLFAYLRRKVSNVNAAVTVILFWSGYFFYYAAEARPYALLLFFFGLSLVSYDLAISARRSAYVLAGVAAGGVGMLLSHVFAPFSMAPFFVAEAVRFRATRKPAWALWAALIVPLASVAIYIPLIRHFRTLAFPAPFQPSMASLQHFYWLLARRSIFGYLAVIAGGLLGALTGFAAGRQTAWKATDLALAAAFAVMPVAVSLAILRTHGAFWERYCITSAAAIAVAAGALLAWISRQNEESALGGFVVLLVVLLAGKVAKPMYELRSQLANAAVLEAMRPDLPLVSASGVTFLEMDHHESTAIKRRLYYLLDPGAAMQYSHSSLFEGFAILKKDYFPIQSNVERLGEFESKHNHFLVLSRPDFPENWLLPKLRDEGAAVREAGYFQLPYEDRNLYEVTLKSSSAKGSR